MGVACGDNEPDVARTTAGDGDGSGGSGDGDGDGSGGSGDGDAGGSGDGDGDAGCAANQELCEDVCTSVQSDNLNCGSCGNECGTGEACSEGQCAETECNTGLVECDGQCVDLQTTEEFCGSCDDACESGESCENGQCEVACPPGFLLCDDECIDPSNNRDYCGATTCDEGGPGAGGAASSDFICGSAQVCVDGACQDNCNGDDIVCDDICVDAMTDEDYCGATDCSAAETSGVVCRGGQECQAGFCENLVPQWEPGVVISDTATDTGTQPILVESDSSGNALVVWRQYIDAGNTELRLFSAAYDATTRKWGAPIRVDDGNARVAGPSLAMAADGTAVAAWIDQGTSQTLRAAFYDPSSGTWGASIRVDAGSGDVLPTTAQGRPGTSVGIDANDDVHFAWLQNAAGDAKDVPRVHTAFWDDSASSLSVPIQLGGYGEYDCAPSESPMLVVDASGAAFMQWRDAQIRKSTDPTCVDGADPVCDCDDITTNDWNLMTATYDTSGGGWSISELAPGTFPRYSHDISVDASGNAYSVWSSYNAATGQADGFVSKFTSGGTWSAPAKVINQGEDVRWIDISTNAGGDSLVVYQIQNINTANQSNEPYFVRAMALSSALAVSNDTSLLSNLAGTERSPNPAVAIAGSGNGIAMWVEGSVIKASQFDVAVPEWGSPGTVNDGVSNASYGGLDFGAGIYAVWHQTRDGSVTAVFSEYR